MKNLEQDIAAMVARPGLYLVTDKSLPVHPITGGRIVVVMFSAGGKIWSMAPDTEMDPNRFLNTAEIHGPFNAPPP